jgi:hypothetical protein
MPATVAVGDTDASWEHGPMRLCSPQKLLALWLDASLALKCSLDISHSVRGLLQKQLALSQHA